jgi:hypothetical protein
MVSLLIVRELAPAQQKARSRGAVAGWVPNPTVGLFRRAIFRHQDSRHRAMRVVMSVMMAKAHRFLKLRGRIVDVNSAGPPPHLILRKVFKTGALSLDLPRKVLIPNDEDLRSLE